MLYFVVHVKWLIMEVEKKLIFFITHEECEEKVIELYEYDTVEILKIEIHKVFDLPPHKQAINGWKTNPESDYTVLNVCAELNTVNCLEVRNAEKSQYIFEKEINCKNEELEIKATSNFIKKLNNNIPDCYIQFHTCSLKNAITKACLAELEKRKILLLYLHNGKDTFSSKFMENLRKPHVVDILKRNFFLLGWDIEEREYQIALQKALQECNDLSNIAEIIDFNTSTALCIVPIKDSIMIMSCLKGKISDNDFLSTMKNAEKFLLIENQQEKDLEDLQRKAGNKNDIGSVKYQQLIADMLGDRDYDGFEFDQHDFLKKKIAFALFGQPKTEQGDGYDEKDMKQVKCLLDIILKNSNPVAKYKDYVEISFIYNCTEPLPSEKIKRAKKFVEYNPNTDLMPVPIFVLRKCHGSTDPCRVFIDHTGRVYETWEEYKNRNKLDQCVMILPINGRYEFDSHGNVLLEKHLSPACGIDTKLLQGADYVSIAGGLISGGIFIAAAIPAITVAPAALLVGGITGIGVGVYSIARSAYTLYDRSKHRESLSFANSEARGAYISILAGALGFVGAGANVVVTQLASRGVNIGTGARAAVDAITIVNVGAGGAAVINSGYDVFDKWVNENQSPSLLTVVQLTSSILFFGNAVYNFRTCSSIVEETQVRTLQDYQDSLRSNRHRKTFSKVMKETIRQNNFNEARGRAEVISAIRNIQNKDEVFAVLTRLNKDLTRKGIKISASGGDIVLNGVKVDFNEFSAMNKKQTTSFLSNLSRLEATPDETADTRSIVSNVFKGFSISDIESVTNVTVKMLYYCTGDVKSKIISALASLLSSLTQPLLRYLDEIFPNHSKFARLLEMVVQFFIRQTEKLEEQYKMWITTGNDSYYNPVFQYVNLEKTKRCLKFFEKAVNMYIKGPQLTELALKGLLTFFHNWLAQKICEYQEETNRVTSRRDHSALSPSTRSDCRKCDGYYFKPTN